MTKKKFVLWMLLVIVVSIVVITSVNTAASENEQGPALTTLYKVQNESFKLSDTLKEQTSYPQLNTHAQALIAFKDVSPEEAIKEAADNYIEWKAMVWYAEQQGIVTTEEDFQQHLDNLIETVKSTDVFLKLSAACAEAGLTVDDLYKRNQEYYRDDFIMDKLYEKWTEKYTNDKGLILESEAQSMDEAWNKIHCRCDCGL